MCGLFGWQFNKDTLPSKRKRRKLAKALTWHMDKRGGQAWGCWADGRVVKGMGDSNGHVQHFARSAVLMGHTRWATHGDKNNLENAHPFRRDKLLLSHNGVLSNHHRLNLKYDRKCVVDSEHLLHHLAEGKPFDEIEGYGVITFLNEDAPNEVRLVRLQKRGDLAVAKTVHGVIWASTRDAVTEACEYVGIAIEQFYEVEPGKIHIAENGGLFIDTAASDMTVKEPEVIWDWWRGHHNNRMAWMDADDDDEMSHWDRLAARPTPPIQPIQLGAEVSDYPMQEEGIDLEAMWELELEAEKASLWLEDAAGVNSAAFVGLKPEEIIDAALDMGWEGMPMDVEVELE